MKKMQFSEESVIAILKEHEAGAATAVLAIPDAYSGLVESAAEWRF